MAKKSWGFNYKELRQKISQEDLPTLVCLLGEEEYYFPQIIEQVKQKYIDPQSEILDFYYHNFQGESKITLELLENLCTSPPFLSKKRLVVLKHTEIFQLGSQQNKAYLDFLAKLPSNLCLILIESKIDQRQKALLNLLDTKAWVASFETLSPLELEKIIRQQLGELTPLSDEVIQSLINRSQKKLTLLQHELQKCKQYLLYSKEENSSPILTYELLSQLCLPDVEADIYKLIDLFCSKNFAMASQEFHKLQAQGEDKSILVVFLLARHIKQLCIAKENSDAFIIQALHLHPFIAKKIHLQAQRFTWLQLQKLYKSLYEMDRKLKQDTFYMEFGLDMLMAEWKAILAGT